MSWLSIFAVIFLILWLRERHLGKQLSRENEALRRRLGGGDGPSPAPRDDALDGRELEELRERIHVLERIATNENSSEARKAQRIAAEIESLRGDIAERRSERDAPGSDRNDEDMDR